MAHPVNYGYSPSYQTERQLAQPEELTAIDLLFGHIGLWPWGRSSHLFSWSLGDIVGAVDHKLLSAWFHIRLSNPLPEGRTPIHLD
jgi:hypothetical protein